MTRLLHGHNVFNVLISLLHHSFGVASTALSGHSTEGNGWTPTDKDVAAAVVYAVSGLCSYDSKTKSHFLNCSAARASTHLELLDRMQIGNVATSPRAAGMSPSSSPSTGSDTGSLFYKLLGAGLCKTHKKPHSVFSVHLLESFLRGTDSGAGGAASRVVLTALIIQALRDSLNCPNTSPDCLPAEVFAALLDALASALLPPLVHHYGDVNPPHSTSQQQQHEIDISPISIANQFSTPAVGKAKLASKSPSKLASSALGLEPVLTIPELTAWVCERYLNVSSTVMCALLRLLARLGDEESYAHVPAARKLHANVLSSEVIVVVWRCIAECVDIEVRSLAVLSMWTILHASESARAVCKQLKASEELEVVDILNVKVVGDVSCRARDVLHELWS